MKKIVAILCILLSYASMSAQDTYTVNGETLELKTEIDGNLDLLWTIVDGKYRYFVRTQNNTILELKNTKGVNNKYQEEYKTTLDNVMEDYGLSTDKVKLTLGSLKDFIDMYNSTSDVSYQTQLKKNKLELRLGVFGGITNNPFVPNPDNLKSPVFGTELEVITNAEKPIHSGFLQLRQVLKNDDLEYTSTEFSLGYRWRAINISNLSIYGNVKFATLNFSKVTVATEDDVIEESDTSFNAPFIFGLGADYKVGNGYITFGFNQLFALDLDTNDNFPTDFTLGSKFTL